MALTEKGKKTLLRAGIVVALVLGFFGLRTAAQKGYGRSYIPAFIAGKVSLDDNATLTAAQTGNVEFAGLPSKTPVSSGIPVRAHVWAWNSQFGCLYSNGGPQTTQGSLMAQQGLNLTITRQDDNNQLRAEIVALAKAMKAGNDNPDAGTNFIAIMMDGSGAFLSALNDQLHQAVGDEYNAVIVGSCGRSLGEDKLMGPAKWRDNPKSLKGAVIAAVVTDGDWNIAVRYALDNGIPINPDWETYDPGAVNFVNTSSYTDAATKAVQGYKETRKVVIDGKPTGRDTTVVVQGAATWTPGDVTMAKEKGGFENIISTKQYVNQMPNAIITLKNWAEKNPTTVQKFLAAALEGGAQVRTYPRALDRAAEISAQIYDEQDAEYWKRYYNGVEEEDKQGNVVSLGGSQAFTLADNLKLFGLAPGASFANSRAVATYTVFGDLVTKMYPKLVASVPKPDDAFDLSYLRAVAAKNASAVQQASLADAAPTVTGADAGRVVGKRSVSIEFATGSDQLTDEGREQVATLARELAISNLNVIVHGHTDTSGDSEANMDLSRRRAATVMEFLKQKLGTTDSREISVVAHGETEPVVPVERTEADRAKNRRVQIVLVQ